MGPKDRVIQGTYSLLGSVSGRCNVITDFDALLRGDIKIAPEDILVTAKTSNYWNQFLTDLRGLCLRRRSAPVCCSMLLGVARPP